MKTFEAKSTKWWMHGDQVLTETCRMLDDFANKHGLEAHYWANLALLRDVIDSIELSDKLILPFLEAHDGALKTVLIEFDIDKTKILSPVKILSYEDGVYTVLLAE